MNIDIIEKGFNENNEKIYYLIVDFGNETKISKLTENQLKMYANKIYSKVENLK